MDNSNDNSTDNASTDDSVDEVVENAVDPAMEVPPETEEELVEDTDNISSISSEDPPEEPSETSSSEEVKPSESSHSLSRLELESLIQRYLDDSEKLKSQLKSQKEMYNAAFENDAEFSQETEVANAAKKKVSGIKQRITKQPAVQSANERMEEIKSEIKDVQEAISGLAEQYQTVAGTNQIVQDDGQILEIIRNFKVIRKKG